MCVNKKKSNPKLDFNWGGAIKMILSTKELSDGPDPIPPYNATIAYTILN